MRLLLPDQPGADSEHIADGPIRDDPAAPGIERGDEAYERVARLTAGAGKRSFSYGRQLWS